MAIATLSIDLEAKLARLEGDMNRATRLIEQQAGKMDRAFAQAGNSLNNLLGSLGGAAIGAGFLAMTRSVLDGIDRLDDLASAVGSTVEKMSALEDIAVRAGSSLDVVSTAMMKMTKVLAAAKPGSDEENVFKQLGLDAAELRNIDPAEAFLKVAQALEKFRDDSAKSRITYELFGKSLVEVNELLRATAQRGELVGKVSREQADAVAKFNAQLFMLQKNATDAGRAVVTYFLEPINSRIASLKAWAAVIEHFATKVGILAKPESKAGGGRGFVNPDQVEPRESVGDLPGKPIKAIKAPELWRGKNGVSADRQEAFRAAEFEQMAEVNKAFAEALRKSAQEADALELKVQGLNSAVSAFRSSEIAATEAVNADMAMAKLQQYYDERLRLNRALEDGRWLAERMGESLASSVGDALVHFDRLSDVVAHLGQQLLQLALQVTLLNPLKNWFTGKLLTMGFADGGAFDGGRLVPFASGGVVTSPHLFRFAQGGQMSTGLMGEAGPEAIMPLQRGPGGKLGVRAAGGGGIVFNQYNTIGSSVSHNEVAAAMKHAERSAVAAFIDLQRRGRTIQ